MSRYPRVIENGAGEKLTLARLVHALDGERLEGDALVSPPAGTPRCWSSSAACLGGTQYAGAPEPRVR